MYTIVRIYLSILLVSFPTCRPLLCQGVDNPEGEVGEHRRLLAPQKKLVENLGIEADRMSQRIEPVMLPLDIDEREQQEKSEEDW